MDPSDQAVVNRLVIEALADDSVQLTDALSEAVTYRELFLAALAELVAERKRSTRANQRLRQVMGVEPWHETETAM